MDYTECDWNYREEGGSLNRKFSFISALLILVSFASISKSVETNQFVLWLNQMREKGLALSFEEYNLIEANPDTLKQRKTEISYRYDEIIAEIHGYRDSLRMIYANEPPSSDAAQSIVWNSMSFTETCLQYVLFPLWSGGEWDFNGYSKYPQSGNIACGWFLQRIMEGVGFNIVSSKSLHLSQAASDEEVWSYSGVYSENLKDWDGLKKYVEDNGYGIHIVGMSAGWGHVLFLRYDPNGAMVFCHAGPSPGGARATYDDAESYVNDFMQPYIIHAARMNQDMITKWLTGENIYPIKAKAYSWEYQVSNWRIKQVQEGLKELGYFSGNIDYKFGPDTRNAIERFQQAESLKVSLLPDNPTLEKLRQLLDNYENE